MISESPINKLIDSVVTPNEKPKNYKEGMLWATHSGILKIDDMEFKVDVLSDGKRIIEEESIKKYFPELYIEIKK